MTNEGEAWLAFCIGVVVGAIGMFLLLALIAYAGYG